MARRRRLTPPQAGYLDRSDASPAPSSGPLGMPPIAQVAGEASATAALEALSENMRAARAEGRLVERLPLDAIDAGYLVRDRIAVAEEDQEALVQSLRARGQQTAIEVVDLGEGRGEGRYGLISGWRRLTALRQLHGETGEDRFAGVLARITRPGEASDAYLAMVEENEIRVGLSHYERARIAVRAVEEGVFRHDRDALDALYASASRPKKSKIRSFVTVVRQLDTALTYPAAIGERLGLDLARRLAEERGFAGAVGRALSAARPADAEAEQAVLKRLLRGGGAAPVARKDARGDVSGDVPGAPAPASGVKPKAASGQITLDTRKNEIRLSGPGVTEDFREALESWLRGWPAG